LKTTEGNKEYLEADLSRRGSYGAGEILLGVRKG